jgi:hypothetical protein
MISVLKESLLVLPSNHGGSIKLNNPVSGIAERIQDSLSVPSWTISKTPPFANAWVSV